MEQWRSYEEWMAGVPEEIRAEDMWSFFGYRKALFFYDLCWHDCKKLVRLPLGKPLAQQLVRSAGSISANIEEGFGRGFQGKERAQFLRIALGSARESKGWYYRARDCLAPEVFDHRLHLIGEVVALLVTEIKRAREAK